MSELFQLRNNFYLGNYSDVILEKTEDLEGSIIYYRSQLALGKYDLVLEELKNTKQVPLQSVLMFLEYLKDHSFEKYELYSKDPLFQSDSTFITLSCSIEILENNISKAILLLNDPMNLEHYSILIQSYLKIFRYDLAESYLKKMSEKNDDATITQLTTCYFYLLTSKYEESDQIINDLMEKYEDCSLLLNLKGIILLQQQSFENANKLFLKALKRNQDSETIIHFIISSIYLNKGNDLIKRYLTTLKTNQHPWMKKYLELEALFE